MSKEPLIELNLVTCMKVEMMHSKREGTVLPHVVSSYGIFDCRMPNRFITGQFIYNSTV